MIARVERAGAVPVPESRARQAQPPGSNMHTRPDQSPPRNAPWPDVRALRPTTGSLELERESPLRSGDFSEIGK